MQLRMPISRPKRSCNRSELRCVSSGRRLDYRAWHRPWTTLKQRQVSRVPSRLLRGTGSDSVLNVLSIRESLSSSKQGRNCSRKRSVTKRLAVTLPDLSAVATTLYKRANAGLNSRTNSACSTHPFELPRPSGLITKAFHSVQAGFMTP